MGKKHLIHEYFHTRIFPNLCSVCMCVYVWLSSLVTQTICNAALILLQNKALGTWNSLMQKSGFSKCIIMPDPHTRTHAHTHACMAHAHVCTQTYTQRYRHKEKQYISSLALYAFLQGYILHVFNYTIYEMGHMSSFNKIHPCQKSSCSVLGNNNRSPIFSQQICLMVCDNTFSCSH